MKFHVIVASLLCTTGIATTVRAQFVDQIGMSDSFGNTGVGSSIMNNLSASGESTLGCGSGTLCTSNTASGTAALFELTTGSNNTAYGEIALFNNTTGNENTAVGASAMGYCLGENNCVTHSGYSSGNDNTAIGFSALQVNTGSNNTATGAYALYANTTGYYNNADGFQALYLNVTGIFNTATGYNALASNTSSFNAAFGTLALGDNTTGSANTAVGNSALAHGTTGSNNTAVGSNALIGAGTGSTGSNNTAVGANALQAFTSGSYNAAVGQGALQDSTTAMNNTALGYEALSNDAIGNGNIAVGYRAGYYVKDGYNIDIGNNGTASDIKTIKIGTENTQLNTYIAGIYNVNSLTGGLAVFVDSTGHLGTASSSERFKADIAPMGSITERLQQLRPVTFHYKADNQGTLRYGLIAEEVAKVYPELVVRDKNGRIDGVRYDELAPMLLNEMQQQHAQMTQTIASQSAKIASLERKVAEVDDLKQQLSALIQEIKTRDHLVAQR